MMLHRGSVSAWMSMAACPGVRVAIWAGGTRFFSTASTGLLRMMPSATAALHASDRTVWVRAAVAGDLPWMPFAGFPSRQWRSTRRMWAGLSLSMRTAPMTGVMSRSMRNRYDRVVLGARLGVTISSIQRRIHSFTVGGSSTRVMSSSMRRALARALFRASVRVWPVALVRRLEPSAGSGESSTNARYLPLPSFVIAPAPLSRLVACLPVSAMSSPSGFVV